MNNKPLVSIITPSYNAMPFLKATVESIKSQNYPNLEHIVMDGGSTDDSIEYLKTQKHIDWTSEKDRGQSHAINKAFAKVKGDIIGWLNADDTYEPETLNTIVKYFMENPEVDFLHSDINIIDEDGEFIGITKAGPFSVGELLIKNKIKQPTLFFRRKIIDELKGVDEKLHYVMDMELWLRMGIKGYKDHYFEGKRLANFRLCKGTKTFEDGPKFLNEWHDVLNVYFNKPFFKNVPKEVKENALRVNRSSYQIDLMRNSMDDKNKKEGLKHFVNAVTIDTKILLNKGLWKFLVLGILGKTPDRLNKFKKVNS
jgi:glycosyltransferase involved in cell wall biosynthesis